MNPQNTKLEKIRLKLKEKNNLHILIVLLIASVFLLLLSVFIKSKFQTKIYSQTGSIKNVKDYGAIANDNKDDTQAINSAINSAAAGDKVIFSSGVYLISASVNLKSGIAIGGSGKSSSIIKFIGTTPTIGMLLAERLNNIEIYQLTIDAGNNKNAINGIYSLLSTNLNIHNVNIKNFDVLNDQEYGPHGIHFAQEVMSSTISNCTIGNIAPTGRWGGGIRISGNSTNNSILSNVISNTGRGGILANDSSNLIVKNNKVSGSHGEGLGIELWGRSDNSIVEDNSIDHWLSIGGDFQAVRRNTISDPREYKFAGIEYSGSNSVFTDNQVSNGSQIGISVSSSVPKEYIFWGYNTIRYATTWGIQMQGESGMNRYQYFYKDKFLNTYRNHPNSWYPNQGFGFRFNGDNYYITLDSVQIDHNQGNGIQFGERIDQISVINSSITNNAFSAVTAYPGNDLEWANNTVYGQPDNTVPVSRGFTNKKPTAAISMPSSGKVNVSVNFVSNSRDSDGTITHALWDFGDGLPVNGDIVTHIYTKTGRYRVSLIVWDNNGRAAHAEKYITIRSR